MADREILSLNTRPKTKPKKIVAPGVAEARAKSAKITLVLDPGSITVIDSIGKKQVGLRVAAGAQTFEMQLNSKTYRKALNTIGETGADNCIVIVQGVLKPKGTIEDAGIVTQIKAPKAEIAPQTADQNPNSENQSDVAP